MRTFSSLRPFVLSAAVSVLLGAAPCVAAESDPAAVPASLPFLTRLDATPASEPPSDDFRPDDKVSLAGWLAGYGVSPAAAGRTACGADLCPRWTAQIDALMLWQGNIPSRPLFTDSVTGATVLDANQAQTPVSVAPRYALLYHRDSCRALEINYFAVSGFSGFASVPQGPNPYAPVDVAGVPVSDIDTAQVATSGGIKSLEFNLRRSYGGPMRWLTGFRWVEWNQTMTLTDSFTDAGGLPGSDTVSVQTGNNLYGWQWGGDLMIWNEGGPFTLEGVAKGGVYYNHQAYQLTQVTSSLGNTALGANKDTVSFVGELGLTSTLALTNWLSWRAGYSVFWLTGVATPANQLGRTDIGGPSASVGPYGSVLLHGVTTGLEARW